MPAASQSRRTQAERSFQTRARVITAAALLLRTRGYNATTIHAIARASGVSLGAMQHHFPTKAQLMATVLRHYARQRARLYRQSVRGHTTTSDKLDALFRTIWIMVSENPEFIAALEIELARRSDPELAAATEPVLARIDQFMSRWLTASTGTTPSPDVLRMLRMSGTFIRGLALERARGTPVPDLHDTFLTWYSLARPAFLKLA